MKRKKKAWRVAIISIALLVVALGVYFVMPFGKTKPFVASDYLYGSDYYQELDNVPVMSQETGYTCYVVSMALAKKHLGYETSENELRAELNLTERDSGMIPNEWLSSAKQVFEPLPYSVSQVNPASETEILNTISDSLENDLPVIIFYSAVDDWNKPHYNTHYAMVYGIDMKKELVKISNPYGYLQELSFAELYAGLDFTSYEAEPLIHRLARKAGVINENNLFVLSAAE